VVNLAGNVPFAINLPFTIEMVLWRAIGRAPSTDVNYLLGLQAANIAADVNHSGTLAPDACRGESDV
jgi:hypothetical protein